MDCFFKGRYIWIVGSVCLMASYLWHRIWGLLSYRRKSRSSTSASEQVHVTTDKTWKVLRTTTRFAVHYTFNLWLYKGSNSKMCNLMHLQLLKWIIIRVSWMRIHSDSCIVSNLMIAQVCNWFVPFKKFIILLCTHCASHYPCSVWCTDNWEINKTFLMHAIQFRPDIFNACSSNDTFHLTWADLIIFE